MDVSISHLIGSVALIGLVIAAGLSYTIVTSSIQDEVSKQQLTQISEYVALNIAEMANLQKYAINSNHYMIRSLNLPVDQAGKTYVVQIKAETSTDESTSYKVRTYLVSKPYLFSEAIIPLNSSSTWLTIITEPGQFLYNSSLPIYTIKYDSTIYGNGETIVWGRTLWSETTTITGIEVGIGWKEPYNGDL